jgi:hypothetical protein
MATTPKADEGIATPKQGDTFRCKACGMEIKVTKGCHCSADDHVHFHCCGQEMVKS